MTPALITETAFILHRLLTFERPADAVLSAFFRDKEKLGARDRAFVAESAYGIIRRLRSLEHLAGGRDPRRLLLAWLARFAGHNLRQFEGLARGSEESEWLKQVKAMNLAELPEAVQLDLPDWLHERLAAQRGDDLAALMAALNQAAPLDLRINPLATDRDTAIASLAADAIDAVATPYSPWGLRVDGKPALNRNALFTQGHIEVQDEGSQLLALLTGAKRGEMVCDFCAGAGGKTLLLGAMMRNTGRLYAFDVAEKRLANLKPRLARSGLSNVHPQLIASERDQKIKRLAGKFDRVLVDAPCSGLGTLRRNPDLKWRQTPESVGELVAKQAAILDSSARLLKLGGQLTYATCSLLSEENEDQVAAFLGRHPDFRLIPANQLFSQAGIALDTGEFLKLDPGQHQTDGFFAAVLERCA
jgi:16S rRNA (cytosine967-C5)-methyltransferase